MKSELHKFSLFNFEIPLGTQNCSLKIAHKYDDYKYMLKHITLLFFVKENYITNRSSYKGRMVNALASGAEEGRDKLR